MDEIKTDGKEETEKESVIKKIPKHNWAIATYIFALLSVVLIITMMTGAGGSLGLTGNVIGESKMQTLTNDFITTQLAPGATVKDISQESGLYVVQIDMQGQTVPVYFTKDGNFITQGRALIPISASADSTATDNTQQPENIPKTDRPKVDLYVMSFCPYGNLAEDTLLPAYNLLKNKVDFNVHFIVSVDNANKVSSLHGQPEVDQNEREACVLNDYGFEKWLAFATYVNSKCGRDGACWQDGAKQTGLDVNKINSCVTSKGVALMKTNDEASSSAGASGSPTMTINGVKTNSVYQYGNADAYKQSICSAFNTAPTECSQALASSNGDATTASGSC